MRSLAAVLAAAVLLLALPSFAQWGRDADLKEQLVYSVRKDIAALIQGRLDVAAIIEKHVSRIEALKRFRDPELKPLFLALCDHEEWHVCHRALLALEYYGDAARKETIDKALPMLDHPNRRMREKAAITLVKLWDGRDAPADLALAERTEREEDDRVRACLRALQRRIDGTLQPKRVKQEKAVDFGGVTIVPFVAEWQEPEPVFVLGGGSPPVATRWVYPLLGWNDKEVDRPGRGVCLEGAGVYAAADGVVRLIDGQRIRVRHAVSHRETVTLDYLKTGDTVFVREGERVTAGQLLGTIGLGFSAENGGGIARLELRDDIGESVDRFLDHWVERTKPLLPRLRPLDPALRRAVREARDEGYADAHVLALKVRDKAEPGSIPHADAVYLLGLLERVPEEALHRVRLLERAGYPRDAEAQLEEIARSCRGLPGGKALSDQLDRWKEDALFRKAVKGETRFDVTRTRAAKMDKDKARALWQKLLVDYADTCLRARIEAELR